MDITALLFLSIGLVVGGALIFFVFQSRISTITKFNKAQTTGLNEQLVNEKRENDNKEKEILNLTRKITEKEAALNHLEEKLNEQKSEIENIQDKFKTEFRNLANDILEEKTKKFTEQNSTRLNEILNPLSQKIKEFEKKVEETYDKETQQRISLKEEVKKLTELNLAVSKEANNLTKALKGESKIQGNWGEVILENILERSGLVKDREYFIQMSFPGESGRRVQPDVVIAYPGERNVVVDSKVSLTAYERYVSATEENEKEIALREHLLSIRNHIKELSTKNYQNIHQIQSLDFVMMFLPIEPAYLLAIQKDPELWDFAYEKRILLISPTNLIASLKMVESMWRQEYQNKNVMEIARQSGALYDKFEGLISDLLNLGKKLDAAQGHYQTTLNKLSEGKGSLVSRVEKIKKLGAKTKKSLPVDLLDKAGEIEEG